MDCVLALWVNAATVINDINSAREPPSRRYLDVSTIVGGNFEDLRKLIEDEFHLRVFESAIVKIVLRLDDPDTDADVTTEKRQPGLANFAWAMKELQGRTVVRFLITTSTGEKARSRTSRRTISRYKAVARWDRP